MLRQNIGIYDEKTLQRQMLHHDLERMEYEILYSCSEVEEFIQNYLIHPVEVILFNAENGIEKAERILQSLVGKKKLSSILLYYAKENEDLAGRFETEYNIQTRFCEGTWEDIIMLLDKLKPVEIKCPDSEKSILIRADSPFYKIATNKVFVRILQLLREGKSVKQISAITGTPEATVSYYLKKMRNETGCSSVVELVMDAKETGVL
jgi:DNA-binding CsgD family transcriptional regulator